MKKSILILSFILPLLWSGGEAFAQRVDTFDPVATLSPELYMWILDPGASPQSKNVTIEKFDDRYVLKSDTDWTGTFDGQEGTWYQDRANHTGTQDWNTITGTPTTIAGYGITDAQNLSIGTDNQVPFVNSGGTDFDYSSNFTFDPDTGLGWPGLGIGGDPHPLETVRIENSTGENAIGIWTGVNPAIITLNSSNSHITGHSNRIEISNVGYLDLDSDSTHFNNTKLTGVAAPAHPTHAVNLSYLDANTQPLDSDLTAIAGLSITGLVVRTGAGTATTRTITGTANRIDITNGDGVSGNPQISLTDSVSIDALSLNGTSALQLPSGTTAQRPSPSFALIRGNSTTGKLEGVEDGVYKDLITGASGASIEENEIAFGDASGNIVSSPDLTFSGGTFTALAFQAFSVDNFGIFNGSNYPFVVDGSGTFANVDIIGQHGGTDEQLGIVAKIPSGSDTGTNAGIRFTSQLSTNALVSTRPLFSGYNYTTKEWEVAASGEWQYQGNTLSGIGQLNVDNLRADGNTFSSTNTNGSIFFTPDGTGVNIFSSQARIQDGSASTPGISFVGSNDTGLYRFGTGIGFSAGGTLRAIITSSGLGVNDITSSTTNSDLTIEGNGTGNIDASGDQLKNLADPTDPQDAATRSWTLSEIASAGGGDVSGPASSTDNTIVRFDGTSGKLIQGSGVAVDDSDNLGVPGHLSLGGFEAMRVEEFELDESDITSLNSSPYELVAAPGAGKAVVLHRAQAILDFNTTAYTLSGSAGFQYDNGTGSNNAALNIQFQGAITATSDYGMASNGSQGTNNQYIFNTNVVFRCFTSNPGGGGDSTMKVKIWYTIEEI